MPAANARSPMQLALSFNPNTKHKVSLWANWVILMWELVALGVFQSSLDFHVCDSEGGMKKCVEKKQNIGGKL